MNFGFSLSKNFQWMLTIKKYTQATVITVISKEVGGKEPFPNGFIFSLERYILKDVMISRALVSAVMLPQNLLSWNIA